MKQRSFRVLLLLCMISGSLHAQNDSIPQTEKIMKIEIWSDVLCPFCYIGKRRLEEALAQFPAADSVEITWKSYELSPGQESMPGVSHTEHLAATKGWSVEQTKQTMSYVTNMAAEAGLKYDFDKMTVAGSFDAHRLIQFAKTLGKGDEMEEVLFAAYFTEGKDIGDHSILLQLAVKAGLPETEAKAILESDRFTAEVRRDVQEAATLGVSGVPFFVFNRKYAISGAQPTEVFLQALQSVFQETQEGAACSPDECK